MSETGESTKSINKRADAAATDNILDGLAAGGRMRLHHKIGRAVLEGLSEKHTCMLKPKTISIAAARRLESAGVIRQSGVDQYMLATLDIPDFLRRSR